MTEVWKRAYLDVRAKIEASERDARWEFDRRRLFERTDYAGGICQDIHDVVQVQMCEDNTYVHTVYICIYVHTYVRICTSVQFLLYACTYVHTFVCICDTRSD